MTPTLSHQQSIPTDVMKARQIKHRNSAWLLSPRGLRAGVAASLLSALLLFTGCATVNSEVKPPADPVKTYGDATTAYLEEKYEEAEAGFKRLMEEYPLDPLSVEAALMLADISYSMARYEEAASYYTNFAAMHPSHPRASYALFQKGMSHFREVLGPDRDQTGTRKAIFAFEDLLAASPGSVYAERAGELRAFLMRRLAERELYIGRFYFKGGNYKGALARFADLLKAYPDSGLSEETLYYIVESYYRLGERGLAEETFSTLRGAYPASPFVKEAGDTLAGG
jgi:outer membrane protein assembly factor BamD